MKIKQSILIDHLISITRENLSIVQSRFSSLDAEIMHLRPKEGGWSIAECLEHLNLYSAFYNKEISKAIEGAKLDDSSKLFKSGWLGNYFANLMEYKEANMTKLSSPKNKNPQLLLN